MPSIEDNAFCRELASPSIQNAVRVIVAKSTKAHEYGGIWQIWVIDAGEHEHEPGAREQGARE
jgi:hypothetical protein